MGSVVLKKIVTTTVAVIVFNHTSVLALEFYRFTPCEGIVENHKFDYENLYYKMWSVIRLQSNVKKSQIFIKSWFRIS